MTAHAVSRAQDTRDRARLFTLPFGFVVVLVGRGRGLRLLCAVADLAEPADAARRTGDPDHGRGRAVRRAAGSDPRSGATPSRPARARRSCLRMAVANSAASRRQTRGQGGAECRRTRPRRPPRPSNERLFVTIAGLGAELPPLERLRTIYPRYIEAQASAGPDGLAILPFRAGTPYEGEDLVYRRHAIRSSFSPAARGQAVPCPAPAFRNARSTPPRSRSAFRATGLAIGATSPPASTG